MAEIVATTHYMNSDYVEYQKQYRRNMRESDKVTIALIKDNLPAGEDVTLLDIGCHNGNLLYHLKKALPALRMTGGDLFEGVIDGCRADPDLAGIDFQVMDVTKLDCPPMDFIVASAVLFRFDDAQHQTVWENIYRSLKPGGIAVTFDFYNPFRQTLRIVDETETHPDGLILTFRSQQSVRTRLREIGFTDINFQMFEIPIDLELQDPTDPIYTHTRRSADGKRLQFRGSLYQPWCHLVARKP